MSTPQLHSPGASAPSTSPSTAGRRLDDNVLIAADGTTSCLHCDAPLGDERAPFSLSLQREQDPRAAGPSVHVPATAFTDRPIVLRQAFCPRCYAVLATQICPADEAEYRTWTLAPGAGSDPAGAPIELVSGV